MRRTGRWLSVSCGVFLVLLLAGFYAAGPLLRAGIERELNRQLKGYTAQVGGVRFHPFGFSLDLLDTTLTQDAHPRPPVMQIPRLHASVQWKALLHLRLVADVRLEQPKLYLNLAQAKAELQSPIPTKDKGWQDALEAIYPLKINEFQIVDGDVTYIDQAPARPLHLEHVNVHAENIRNIAFPNNLYPSTLQVESTVFDTGHLALDGRANFLAMPHATMRGAFRLAHINLEPFQPITRRYNINVEGGILATAGQYEYGTEATAVQVDQVTIDQAAIEYVHQRATAAREAEIATTVVRSAKQVSNNPHVFLSVDKLAIRRSTFGYRDDAAASPYRLFLANADIHLSNVSNHNELGKAAGTMTGQFMGSGATRIGLTLLPAGKSLDMDVAIQIEGTDLTALNGLLRTYAGFDVARGQFSFYSEDRIRQGYLTGYVKPLFKDLKVSAPETAAQKGVGQKLKERLIAAIAWILRNPPHHEVGTTVTLAGDLNNPQYSSWEAVRGLLRNAFLQPLEHRFGRG